MIYQNFLHPDNFFRDFIGDTLQEGGGGAVADSGVEGPGHVPPK